MENIINDIKSLGVSAGSNLLYAIIVLVVGIIVINAISKAMKKHKGFSKLDPTIDGFLRSAVKISLYVILIISIIGILGIPMASVVAVLASAGVAIGLSLQGALSNLAGGIMLMMFRPFHVGDYVSAAGEEGTVESISVFYTFLITFDNKRITIPNGSLMNSNVTNYSSEPLRRVDLVFRAAFGTDCDLAKGLMVKAANDNNKVLYTPAPEALINSFSDNSINFQLRAWCPSADYWDVNKMLMDSVTAAFMENNIAFPATKVDIENK